MAVILFLGALALVPFGLVVAMPVRALPYLIGWVGLAWLDWILWPSHGRTDGWSDLGNALVLGALGVGIGAALPIKLLHFVVAREARFRPAPPAAAILGALIGLALFLTAFAGLQPVRPTWLAHALAAGLAVLVALTIWVLPWARLQGDWRWFVAGVSGAPAILAILAGVFWAVSINAFVARAEKFAGEKPYCIQVAKPLGRYEQPQSLLDLSPLTMRSRCKDGFCLSNHATLVMDGAIARYWSYYKLDFMKRPLEDVIYCREEPHFLKQLPIISFRPRPAPT